MENDNTKQSTSNTNPLPHQRFDIVAKDVIYAFPEDMLQFLMGESAIEFVEHLESELPTVEARQMDSLIKVRLDGDLVLVHCEFQTSDSTHQEMVRRTVGYLGRCYERYGLPIFSHVIYLRPDAGRADPGGYIQEVAGYRFIVEYKVIRLITVAGQGMLDANQPGLMPFCPLMQPPADMDALEWLHECVEATRSLSLDAPARNNLLTDMWVMSGLVHAPEAITNLFPEDIMQESSVYQYITEKARAEGIEQGLEQGIEQGLEQGIEQGLEQGIEQGLEQGIEQGLEQGIEQGSKESTIEAIILILDTRFETNTAYIKPLLETIDDLSSLKHSLRYATEARSLEAFISHLSNGNAALR